MTIATGRWEHSAPDVKKYTKEEAHTHYLFLPLLSKPNQQLRYLSQTIDNKIVLPTLQIGSKTMLFLQRVGSLLCWCTESDWQRTAPSF